MLEGVFLSVVVFFCRLRQNVDESVDSQRKTLEDKEHYERELRQAQNKARVRYPQVVLQCLYVKKTTSNLIWLGKKSDNSCKIV